MRLRIEFGFHPGPSKELPDPGGLRWDFAFPGLFFPPMLPHFCGRRRTSQRETLFATNVYATDFGIRSPVAGETMSILQTEKRYLFPRLLVITRRINDEDTLGFYAPLASSTYEGDTDRSVRGISFMHKTFMRLKNANSWILKLL